MQKIHIIKVTTSYTLRKDAKMYCYKKKKMVFLFCSVDELLKNV